MTPAPLDVSVAEKDGATIVTLCGDGDIANADVLTRALLPLTARRPMLVMIECADLKFISSLLIGLLVQFQRGLSHHGGTVRLIAPRDSVLKALRHARLDSLFEIDAADDRPLVS